ncbi:DUF418 domain-containing protein [Rossellomorea vietnamensis]|uniref:DUF418 domain-containing protein n=1 Tax=Rossellomorea vietnamensis TaxID=218284 RepID=A0A5D4NIT0_9BACI|nr:DUF418 domain-containing protein [Rossellomorea vietnamensis]TYS14143.1 DUF418 domain-containing protein [Rossellomorea vietnamensis]
MNSSPILGSDRIVTIDIIRGFALFGIFLVNMPAFHSAEFLRSFNAVEADLSGVDYWIDLFFALFIDMKFFTIFSFLFGLGFYIFMSRAEQKELKVTPLYLRRILGLFLFGAAHLIFLWFGDILHTYALTGLLLLAFYKRKIKTMIIWAFSLLLVINALFSLTLLLPSGLLEEFQEMNVTAYNAQYDEYVDAYTTAGYGELISYRLGAELVPLIFNAIPAMIPVLAMFLFGLAAGKAGIFRPDTQHLGLIRKIRTISFLISIPLVALLALYKLEIFGEGVKNSTYVQVFTSLSGVTLCFFYISALTLLLRKNQWQKRLRPLGFAGQMALTNYLSQSIICVLIFVGLDLYEEVSLWAGTLIALAIFSAQIIISYFWLKKFQFGPFEWLWRSFTYGKFQSMKKKNPAPGPVDNRGIL